MDCVDIDDSLLDSGIDTFGTHGGSLTIDLYLYNY